MKKILVLNGPNLNLLGIREPQIYGGTSLNDINDDLKKRYNSQDLEIFFFQSNHEGELIDFIQEHMNDTDGIILNPASFSSTGYGILDAIKAINIPFIEVHLSNIFARGTDHEKSIFSKHTVGFICGFKAQVYELALLALIKHIK